MHVLTIRLVYSNGSMCPIGQASVDNCRKDYAAFYVAS